MLAAMYVIFILTYLPSLLIKIVTKKTHPPGEDIPFLIPDNYYQFDKCYNHETIHIMAYVINWASVVINPILYVVSQKKYKVRQKIININCIIGFCFLYEGRYHKPERHSSARSTFLFPEWKEAKIY